MTTKYISVTFIKQETMTVTAQVETDLSGVELEDKVEVPHEWMEQYFGDEWESWEIEDVTSITEDWSILKNRSTDASSDRELSEAPLFEIANDEEVEQ